MKTSILLLTGLIVVTSSAAGQAAGQHSAATSGSAANGQNVAGNAAADCDYNTCALRMKLSWGSWRIVRGEHGRRVGTLGTFRSPDVESLVASSPDAVAEARIFRKNYMAGEVLQAIGGVIAGVSAASSGRDGSAVGHVTGVVGGFAILFYGVSRSNRAIDALSKSIWLYNRSLQR